MANRQIARALRCSHSTVAHQIARLGRHCLLYQARELKKFTTVGPVAIDGFESFEWSQYYPFHHNVAVGTQTGYFLFHTDSPLRRKGRMTAHQKRRRAQLEATHGRADANAVEVGVRELVETVVGGKVAVIRSDDHRAYPRSMRGLSVSHQITSSKDRRDRKNPLWEVNLLDLMIRHSTSAHKRETIAWAKRRQASAEKLAIFQVWRNYIKRRWEKGAPVSSAMLAGLSGRLLRTRDVLSRRLFRTRLSLPRRWALYYDRKVETVPLAVNRRHCLTYAY